MKKSFEITKSQIDTLCSGVVSNKEVLVEWFPEAFAKELEVGKWYKVNRTDCFEHKGEQAAIVLFKGYGIETYGFSHRGNWTGAYGGVDTFTNPMYEYTEATSEEVEEALVKQVILRGYTQENTISLSSPSNNFDGFCFDSHDNSLYSARKGNGGKILFRDGKWAEIKKEDLVVGNWYKHTNGHVVNYQGKSSGYGWLWKGGWYNNEGWSFNSDSKNWKPASSKEVIDLLDIECKERGYGVRDFKCLAIGCINNTQNLEAVTTIHSVWTRYGKVFDQGKWAEKIETISKKDAEKQLGKIIV